MVLKAAMPYAAAIPPYPFSMAVTLLSSALTVGLLSREYM